MFRHLPTLEELIPTVRKELCADCKFRPDGSGDPHNATTPLTCEAGCPVFVHLPVLTTIATRVDSRIASHERVMDKQLGRILQTENAACNDGDETRVVRLCHHRHHLVRLLGRVLKP